MRLEHVADDEQEKSVAKPPVDAELISNNNMANIERLGQALFAPLAEAGAAQARAQADVSKHAIDADKEVVLRYQDNVGAELARRHTRYIILSVQVSLVVLPIVIVGLYLLVAKESPLGWSLITLVVGGAGGAGGGYYMGRKSASAALPPPPTVGEDPTTDA